jgi:Fic family protein
MAGPAWDDEMASARVEQNLLDVAAGIIALAGGRELPNEDLVREWHRRMLEGVDLPDDAYRGAFRGDPHPAVADYQVAVGGLATVPFADVRLAIRDLVSHLQARVGELDRMDAQLGDQLSAHFIEQVLEVAAWLHGEWVRIHPFVNGNGRTARMWVLWLCVRYGLPQLLPLRPRPDMVYGPASLLSMTGNHSLFGQYLLMRYNQS